MTRRCTVLCFVKHCPGESSERGQYGYQRNLLHKSVQILAYANDVIVGRYESAVKDAFNVLEMEAQKWV